MCHLKTLKMTYTDNGWSWIIGSPRRMADKQQIFRFLHRVYTHINPVSSIYWVCETCCSLPELSSGPPLYLASTKADPFGRSSIYEDLKPYIADCSFRLVGRETSLFSRVKLESRVFSARSNDYLKPYPR